MQRCTREQKVNVGREMPRYQMREGRLALHFARAQRRGEFDEAFANLRACPGGKTKSKGRLESCLDVAGR